MRMWNVNPKLMCRQHLLGEHLEMHMFIGHLRKGRKLKRFIENRLVEPRNIIKRHDVLVKEMSRRGYNHQSPISPKLQQFINISAPRIDPLKNELELTKRCKECRNRIYQYHKGK